MILRTSHILRRLENQYQDIRSDYFGRREINWSSPNALISFTFDDFPRSAYQVGGKILQKYKLRGSFYASFGLMGTNSPTGEIFTLEDLKEMMSEGHEIGCHTYDHLDAWSTSAEIFEESIIRNQRAAEIHFPGLVFKTMAYPKRRPHPRIKRLVGKHFVCCRAGGQTINTGKIDLNLVRSCFIDRRNRENYCHLIELIKKNSKEKGWLIFSTHDVSISPSAFGCPPEVLEEIVRCAVDSRATILPVREVCSRIAP
jgi:hypothetical protein